MCLAVPTKIIEIDGLNAVVDIDGISRSVNIAFIDNPAIGDYVIVHAGFGIQKWSQDDVDEFNDIMKDVKGADQQL